MILDNFLLLSGAYSAAGVLTAQAVAGTDTTVLSTNTLDNGSLSIGSNQASDLGAGEDLYAAIAVVAAPSAGTSVQFQIVQADDAALTSNLHVIGASGVYPIASLPAGTLVPVRFDPAAPFAPKRYIGVRYNLVGAIASMTCVATLVKDMQAAKNIFFKSGYAVL